MTQESRYDVIIIGTGAGGGTLAHRLAPSGKRILMLERGPYLRRERENYDSTAVFAHGRYRAKETWHTPEGAEFHPGIQYFVGGNTKVYGAALYRLRPEDFGEIRHPGGVSPAWPISYDDLEPYYSQAEQLYEVHGRHGEDPTEGAWSMQYPKPPVMHEPRIQQLNDDLVRAGLSPFHAPAALLLDQDDSGQATPTSPCMRCNRFDGFPCMLRAKSDAEVICVTPALQHENVSLLTDAYVSRLVTDPSGRAVIGVEVEREDPRARAQAGGGKASDTGTADVDAKARASARAEDANGSGSHTETYSADIVIVACGAINSALLLLRSASEMHPNGLANSSQALGRHYMRHVSSVLMALSKEPNPTAFQKTLAVNDFYLSGGKSGEPLGNIQMVGKSDGEQITAEAPAWAGVVPEIAFADMAKHSIDFWLMTEDLPLPENRVRLGPDGKAVIALHDTNLAAHKQLKGKLESLLGHLGLHRHLLPRNLYLGKQMDVAATAHQAGTARFGADPRDCVLDLDCKAHDLDNLYVVDGSFMPSVGAVNPALTIIANALRVGDHLLQRLQ